MTYFRKIPKLHDLIELLSQGGRWLIFVNADPDAMASAMALKRIMSRKALDVGITNINEVTRPDNLAMIRYCRLHMQPYTPDIIGRYNHFAIVDSQPHHNHLFADVPFSVIIDHHPLPETETIAAYKDIRPDYGAASTMLAEYLHALEIRPAKLLATALQFGIKSDTLNFERKVCDADLRIYRYLAKFANLPLLTRITRSEFHARWLDYFARACVTMQPLGSGQFVYFDDVENPDVLVAIADFFMRVYEFRWVVVSGVYRETAVVVFRSDGIVKDVGQMAAAQFGDLGSAGGHKALARAEFPIAAAGSQNLEELIYQRVAMPSGKKKR